MGKLEKYLIGFKTILGAIIQIAGAVGMVANGIMDYLNSVPGGGGVKTFVGLGFAGNAIGQIGIRFAKKRIEIQTPSGEPNLVGVVEDVKKSDPIIAP